MTTDQYLQLAAIAGTFLLAAIAIWGDLIRAKLLKPKISLEVDNVRGDLTVLRSQNANGAITETRGYYYHLKLVNLTRWTSIKQCRVLLKAISQRGPDGVFRPLPFNVPLQYVWAPAEMTPSTISIAKDHLLDFGVVPENSNSFVPTLYSRSNNFRGDLPQNSSIRYSLEVVAENYSEDSYHVIEVSWDGQWSDDREQMKDHLVIKKIKES